MIFLSGCKGTHIFSEKKIFYQVFMRQALLRKEQTAMKNKSPMQHNIRVKCALIRYKV